MTTPLDHYVARAKSAAPAWSRARHEDVRAAVERRFAERERRKRAVVVARSGLVGAALLALAVRAFGGPAEAPGAIDTSSAAGPQVAYDDGGFYADVARD